MGRRVKIKGARRTEKDPIVFDEVAPFDQATFDHLRAIIRDAADGIGPSVITMKIGNSTANAARIRVEHMTGDRDGGKRTS